MYSSLPTWWDPPVQMWIRRGEVLDPVYLGDAFVIDPRLHVAGCVLPVEHRGRCETNAVRLVRSADGG